ncbi:histidine phosphatase family protein [Candidatus Acetothermia bacterium]|nr:histidine phosphatase family protein [Candidatus Acetothermia bacterium]MCI2431892.1 histidine phosphatase family protein [Candidatus Acetothermia bacterium]MCI2437375.1 histidine phosphatase family protein [Candidatus Acetothermia bacterium]
MRKLILVKHSLPKILPRVPASQWHLSAAGRLRCRALADRLAAHHPDVIISSTEPKAVETAQIVARTLSKPFEIVEDLHEHDRSTIGLLSKEEFERAVARFFDVPDKLVFGTETANQAYQRFSRALLSALEKYPKENIAVITHGTVITLFVSRVAGLEPSSFWQRLGLPSFAVLSLPELQVLAIVENVET